MYVLVKDGEMTSLLSKFQAIRLHNSENCYMPIESGYHPMKILPLIQNGHLLIIHLGILRLQLPISRASCGPSKGQKQHLTDLAQHPGVHSTIKPLICQHTKH